ncbi:MAG: putative inorganic carbon transporter subunit DabA, partial [Gemmataceae bacterium]
MLEIATSKTIEPTKTIPDAKASLAAMSEELMRELAALESIVPPLWPLRSYVAVNPFLGLSGQRFLNARQTFREVRDCEMLPSLDHYAAKIESGQIARPDIEEAYRRAVQEYPELYAGLSVEGIVRLSEHPAANAPANERRWFAISELIDRQTRASWTSHILNDVTRHCGAHFDEGQAIWSSPWKGMPFYTAWREAASLSWRMDQLGIPGFRKLVRELPKTPTEAIRQMLQELDLPPDDWRSFLMCEIFSISGWASYVRYRVREAEIAGQRDEDLIGLLAARLAYDVALARVHPKVWREARAKAACGEIGGDIPIEPPQDVLARYVLQVATEVAHRRTLLAELIARNPDRSTASRKTVQMVFCIDVRSEVMRRHL